MASPELKTALAWLHKNAYRPQRRTAALLWAYKNLQGKKLTTFTSYATGLSYAFNSRDLAILHKIQQKQQLQSQAAPPETSGVGQIYIYRQLRSVGQDNGIGEIYVDRRCIVPGTGKSRYGIGQDFGSILAADDEDDEMYKDLQEKPTPSNIKPPSAGSASDTQKLIGSLYGETMKTIRAFAPEQTTPTKTKQKRIPTSPIDPTPTRPAPGERRGAYVWNGTKWIYSPISSPPTTPTSPPAPKTEEKSALPLVLAVLGGALLLS